MGLITAFDDFRRISTNTLLEISEIIHETKIDINDEYTETKSETCISIREGCLVEPGIMDQEIIEFICDRPFIFIIHETIRSANSKNKIIFLGKFMKPE